MHQQGEDVRRTPGNHFFHSLTPRLFERHLASFTGQWHVGHYDKAMNQSFGTGLRGSVTADDRHRDNTLVAQCLAGSEEAWREFYGRFVGLIRSVIRRHSSLQDEEIEDAVQASFLALTTALKNFDPTKSLARFVCLVTDRVLIDEYRKVRAAKRDGEATISADSATAEHMISEVPSNEALQDERVEKAEEAVRLKAALDAMDPRCRTLLTLRFIDDLTFKDIAQSLGQTENTVTVQTRRCLESLRERYLRLGRKGRTP